MPTANKIFKIMHMSDLHLGKSLRSRDLSEDQAHALGQIVAAARSERPDLVLVAGDVFDRSIPSEVAQTMFGRLMADLRRALAPEAKILVIPGNHDSPRRVAFAAELFESVGIHLVSEVRLEPALVLEKGGARLAVWALPFVTHGLLNDFRRRQAESMRPGHESSSEIGNSADKSPETRAESSAESPEPPEPLTAPEGSMASRLGELIAAFRPHLAEFDANIIAAHCYVRGATLSESDTDFLGGTEAVPASLFDDFDYAALGHLHRQQRLSDSVWYAGAPMAMSFGDGEGEKGLLSVELEIGQRAPRVMPIAIDPLRRFRRVRGTFAELTAASAPEDSDYIEAVLTDENPVYNAFNGLVARFQNLMSVRQEAFEKLARGLDRNGAQPDEPSAMCEGEAPAESAASRVQSPREIVLEDFRSFCGFILNGEAPEELSRRFDALLKAEEGENA